MPNTPPPWAFDDEPTDASGSKVGSDPSPHPPQASGTLTPEGTRPPGYTEELTVTPGAGAESVGSADWGFGDLPGENYIDQSGQELPTLPPQPLTPEQYNPKLSAAMSSIFTPEQQQELLPLPAGKLGESAVPTTYPGTQQNLDVLNALPKIEAAAARQALSNTMQGAYLMGRTLSSPNIEGWGRMIVPYMDPELWPGATPLPEQDPALPRQVEVDYIRFKGESEDDAMIRTKQMLIDLAKQRKNLQATHFLEGAMLNLPRASTKVRDWEQRWDEDGFGWDEGDAAIAYTLGMATDMALGFSGQATNRVMSFSDALFLPVHNAVRRGLTQGALRSVLSPTAERLGGWGAMRTLLAQSPELAESAQTLNRQLILAGGHFGEDGAFHIPAEALASTFGPEVRANMQRFAGAVQKVDPKFKLILQTIPKPVSTADKLAEFGKNVTSSIAGGEATALGQAASELAGANQQDLDQWPQMLAETLKSGAALPVGMTLAGMGLRGAGGQIGELLSRNIRPPSSIERILSTLPKDQPSPDFVRPAYLGEDMDPHTQLKRVIVGETKVPDPEPVPSASELRQVALPVTESMIPDADTHAQILSNLETIERAARVGHPVELAPDPRQGLRELNTQIMHYDDTVSNFIVKGLDPPSALDAASQDLLSKSQQWADAYRSAYSGDNALPWTPAPHKVTLKDIASDNPHERVLAADEATQGQTVFAGWLHNGPDLDGGGAIPLFLVDGRIVANMTEGNIPASFIPKPGEGPIPHLTDVTDSLLGLRLPDSGFTIGKNKEILDSVWFENSPTSPIEYRVTRDQETAAAKLSVDYEGTQRRDLQRRALQRVANPKMAPIEEAPDILYDMNMTNPVSEANREVYSRRVQDARNRLALSWKGLDDLASRQLPPESDPADIAHRRSLLERPLLFHEALLAEAERRLGVFQPDDIDGQVFQSVRKSILDSSQAPEGKVPVYRLADDPDPAAYFSDDLHGTLTRALESGKDLEIYFTQPETLDGGVFRTPIPVAREIASEAQRIEVIAQRDALLSEKFHAPDLEMVSGESFTPGLQDLDFMERNLHLLDPELQSGYRKLRQRFVSSVRGGDLFSDEAEHRAVLREMHDELNRIERSLNVVKAQKVQFRIEQEKPWMEHGLEETPATKAIERGNILLYRYVRNAEEIEDLLYATRVGRPSLGFREATHIDGHSLARKSRKIAAFYKKHPNGVAVFGSPLPTVAAGYGDYFGPGALIAVELPPEAIIYKSSALDWNSGSAAATFPDSEIIFDGRQAKKVSFLSPEQTARTKEYYDFFDSQRKSGYFRGVYKDRDPALVAANLVQVPNLLPLKTSLGRPFLEAPITLPNGLQVKKGLRVKLANGATTVLNGYRSGKPLWEGQNPFPPRLEGSAFKGEKPTPGYNLNIPLEDVVAVWDKENRRWVNAPSEPATPDAALAPKFSSPAETPPPDLTTLAPPALRERLGLGGNTIHAAEARMRLKQNKVSLASELAAKRDLAGIQDAISNLPAPDRAVTETFLSTLLDTGYFRGLRMDVDTTGYEPTGALGRFFPRRNLIEIYAETIRLSPAAKGQIHPTVLHELWHALSMHLPVKEMDAFKALHEKALDSAEAEFPWLGVLRQRGPNGKAVDSSGDIVGWTDPRIAHLRNLDEFFVSQMFDRTTSHLTSVLSNPVVARAKLLWNALVTAIHRTLGQTTARTVFDDFLNAAYAVRDPSIFKTLTERTGGNKPPLDLPAMPPPPTNTTVEALQLLGTGQMKRKHWDTLTQAQRVQHLTHRFWNLTHFDPSFPMTESNLSNSKRIIDRLEKLEPKLTSEGSYDGGVRESGSNWKPSQLDFDKLHEEWSLAKRFMEKKVATLQRLGSSPAELTPAELLGVLTLTAYDDPAQFSAEEFASAVQTVMQNSLANTRGESFMGTHPPGWHDAQEAFYAAFEKAKMNGTLDRLPERARDAFNSLLLRIEEQHQIRSAQLKAEQLEAFDLGAGLTGFSRIAARQWRGVLARLNSVEKTLATFFRRYTRPMSDTLVSMEMASPGSAIKAMRGGLLDREPTTILTRGASNLRQFLIEQARTLSPILRWLQKSPDAYSHAVFNALDVGIGPEAMKIQRMAQAELPAEVAKAIGKTEGKLSDLVLWFRNDWFPSMWRQVEGPLATKYRENAVSFRMANKYIRDNMVGIALQMPLEKRNILDAAIQKVQGDNIRYTSLANILPSDEAFLETLFSDKAFLAEARKADSRLSNDARIWSGTRKAYLDQTQKAENLEAGRGRKENYAPHVFFKTHLLPELHAAFEGDLFAWAAFLPKETFNEFLKNRAGIEGYTNDLASALMVYIPVMGRTIHIEPAIRRAIPLIDQIPNPAYRQKLRDMTKNLLGKKDVTDVFFNEAVNFEIANGRTLIAKPIAKEMQARPQAYAQGNVLRKVQRAIGTSWFIANVDPWTLASLNVFEHLMIPLALGNSPGKFVRGIGTWAKNAVKSGGQLGREALMGNHALGRFVSRQLHLNPYTAEARLWGSAETYHDISLTQARQAIRSEIRRGDISGGEFLNKAWTAAFWQQVLVDQHERITAWNSFKSSGLAAGMTEEEAKLYAKFNVDRLFSDHSRAGQSPYTVGGFAPTAMLLKRFMLNRADDIAVLGQAASRSLTRARQVESGQIPQPGTPALPLKSQPLQTIEKVQTQYRRGFPEPAPRSGENLPIPHWFTPEEAEILQRMRRPLAETWWGKYPSPEAIAAARWRTVFTLGAGLPAFYALAQAWGRNFSYVLPWYWDSGLPLVDWIVNATDATMTFPQHLLDVWSGNSDPETQRRRETWENKFEEAFPMPWGSRPQQYRRRLSKRLQRDVALGLISEETARQRLNMEAPRLLDPGYMSLWFKANFAPWSMPEKVEPITKVPKAEEGGGE